MASFAIPCPKCVVAPRVLGFNSQNPQRHRQILSFQNGSSFRSSFSGPALTCCNSKQFSSLKVQAQPNKATTVKDSSNSAPSLVTGSEAASSKEKGDHNGKPSGPGNSLDASTISTFMAQVSNLVKLVDSRDIVELQLKQSDCELVIRKKEALEPPPAAAVAFAPPMPYHTLPSPPPAPVSASAPASPPPSKPAAAAPSPAKPSTSSHPPLKCPMAGTFYRSPAPGEPPFVKVGDKVQKGQVICIIEAMKLMNEIEADQSGTIAEVIAEDGKPVSVDTPLFVIVP